MKLIILYLLAFAGGVFLAMQAGFNTLLNSFLKQPVLAAISTSVFSATFASVYVLVSGKGIPEISVVRQVPWYLWGIGGLFSMLGISLYFYTIPKLGISRMIALGLCGQLVFSLVAGKFGWLNLAVEPFTAKRLAGIIAMIGGIILINTK